MPVSSHFDSEDLDELFSGNIVHGLEHVTTGDFVESFGCLTAEMIFLDKTTGKHHRTYITKRSDGYDGINYDFDQQCDYVEQREVKIKQWVAVASDD